MTAARYRGNRCRRHATSSEGDVIHLRETVLSWFDGSSVSAYTYKGEEREIRLLINCVGVCVYNNYIF